MAKKSSRSQTDEEAVTGSNDSMVTLSVRLTERERKLLQEAADSKGWSATSLLRRAAIERSIHIINTGTPRNLNFRGLAQAVAVRLASIRRAWILDDEGRRVEAAVVESLADAIADQERGPVAEVEPQALSEKELASLEIAAERGGSEFLNMVVEACVAEMGSRVQANLPTTIDPKSIDQEEG